MPPLVMWTVYKHPNDYPAEYVARKFVITEDFYGPSNELISSRSLRDVRNLLRSLYRGLIQLSAPPTTNRISWRYGYDKQPPRFPKRRHGARSEPFRCAMCSCRATSWRALRPVDGILMTCADAREPSNET